MIDKKWIGHELPVSELTLERGRMRAFARAIGEDRPVYTDEAGRPGGRLCRLPAPPTFLFAAELDSGDLTELIEHAGHPAVQAAARRAGLQLPPPGLRRRHASPLRSKVTDIYDKKGGALEFVVKTSQAHNQRGELVADLRSVIVVPPRRPEGTPTMSIPALPAEVQVGRRTAAAELPAWTAPRWRCSPAPRATTTRSTSTSTSRARPA
jgi:hypothetical protein